MKSAAPTPTSMCVRRPAARSRSSRSRPIAPVSAAATSEPDEDVPPFDLGDHATASLCLAPISSMPGGGEVDERVELGAAEGHALGRRLHLDQAPVAGHDDVHVHVGRRVLLVVEVEERLAVDDPDGDGADEVGRLGEPGLAGGERQRDPGARDRRGARAAVGLEHVAVDPDRALAERRPGRTTARSERPSSRWISTVRPFCLPALASRCVRWPVEAGSIPYSAVSQPRPAAREPARHAVLDAGRAEDARARRRR